MALGSYTPKQRMEVLFQPRTITFGLRPTEESHVQVLMQAIRAGETPPQPVVIKLKDEGYVLLTDTTRSLRTGGASGGFITVVLTDFEVRPIHHTRHAVNEPICSPG